MFSEKKVLIKGTGEVASGCARRLHLAGFSVLLTERELPPAVPTRPTLGKALTEERVEVFGLTGIKIDTPVEAEAVWRKDYIPVLLDPEDKALEDLSPDIVVDARMAGSNTGTRLEEAPIVIGVGSGFQVGVDCQAVVGATPGADLGWARYSSGESAAPAATPGVAPGGGAGLTSPGGGPLKTFKAKGQQARKGEIVAEVGGKAIRSPVAGTIQNILASGTEVGPGESIGEVLCSERAAPAVTSPDSPAAISGGVLEAVLHLVRPK